MKTQKLLLIVALVCLMAFLNVSTFAQTAQAEPGPARALVRFMAQTLRAEGYDVVRIGNSLEIQGEIILELPYTLEKLEDSGIRVRSVPQADTLAEDPAENIDDFLQLKQCLDAADLLYTVNETLCEINPYEGLCKTEALFARVINSLKCIALYVPQEPPSGDVVSVFVTSGEFEGDLGGLSEADAECQAAADTAGLGGTWTAWLSDSMKDAIDRIPNGQYRLVDGTTQVADDKADLTDGRLKAAIILTEKGETRPGSVWTGTEANGIGTLNNCNNWTDNSAESGGDFGYNAYEEDYWTLLPPPAQCSDLNRLYCFGVTDTQ